MDEIKLVLRDAVLDDKNFIFSTWLKGNYFGGSYWIQMPQDLYYEEYAKKLNDILVHPKTQIFIACDQNNPSWVVGFIVFRNKEVYWIYVKKDFREKGIANLLIKDLGITTAKGMTRTGRIIADKKGIIFNPL